MVVQARTIKVTPELQLLGVLEAAQQEPVLLEQDGVLFRLAKEDEALPEDETDWDAVVQRGESESLGDYLERVSNAIMRGRRFEDDTTDLLNEARADRDRELS